MARASNTHGRNEKCTRNCFWKRGTRRYKFVMKMLSRTKMKDAYKDKQIVYSFRQTQQYI